MSEHGVVASLLAKLGVTPDAAQKAAKILSEDDMTKPVSNPTTKAMPHATELTSSQMVASLWEEGQLHRVPGPDVLKVGPVQEASGGGAERMISEYSNPAPQMGIQLQAEELARHLHPLYGTLKSIALRHDALVDVVTKSSEQIGNLTTVAAAILAKAEEHEKDKEKEKEKEDEHDEHHMDKAATFFKKARRLMRKSRAIKGKAKAIAVKADARPLKEVAVLLRKAAARYLMRARTEALAGRGPTIDRTFESRKAIDAYISRYPALKADIEEIQHEKKEKDEEAKARQLYKATKAGSSAQTLTTKAVEGHADADGNQADRKDPETGNQDDSAVKAAVADLATKIDSALNGVGLLKTNVQGLMDTISGRAITPPVGEVVSLLKSATGNVSVIDAISERIDAAVDEGLDQAHLFKAKSLLARLDGVQKGAIAKGIFDNELANAPTRVRDFFQAA